MKKFLSLLLALSLVLSLGVTAFAVGNELVDGDNEIELPWDTDEVVTYTYTATQTGTLYLSVNEFYYAEGDFDYVDNMDHMDELEMYTELKVDGQLLEGIYYGGVEVVQGQTYTITWEHLFAAEKWYKLGWKAVLNLSYSGEYVPEQGTMETPVELFAEECPVSSIEVPAGGTVWYLLYDFGGTHFTVTGEQAYVTMTIRNMETDEDEVLTFEPENGVVTVPMISARVLIQIGNSGVESATFELNYICPMGSQRNPAELKLEENVATFETISELAYYFLWTAPCNATLILTMPEEDWMASVQNLTAGTNPQFFYSTNENVIEVEVSAGDEILFAINYINDDTFEYAVGEVKFTAEAEYIHEYADGVCIHCGAQEEDQGGEDPVTVGDVNGDGRINARDARALLRLVAGLTEEGEVNEAAADVNGDGRINARDARTLLRQIAGLE